MIALSRGLCLFEQVIPLIANVHFDSEGGWRNGLEVYAKDIWWILAIQTKQIVDLR